eukprot:m51a1_g9337 hypothetical protein (175) ;mRNA; f:55564-56289
MANATMITAMALLLFFVFQVTALGVTNWPRPGDVRRHCGSDCSVVRSMQATQATGTLAALMSAFAFFMSWVATGGAPGGPWDSMSDWTARLFSGILCILTFIFSLVSLVVWPAVFKDHYGNQFFESGEREDWFALQIIATFLALVSVFCGCASVLCGGSDEADNNNAGTAQAKA